jgi:ribosomal protein S12 methylthiotransferase
MIINIITLGCSKNLVDSEYLLRQFHSNGHKVFHDEADIDSDVVILNTCGFILDAKEESIDNILHYVDLKKQGKVKKVIVMGCLSERYREDLIKEIPEVDAFFCVWDHEALVEEAENLAGRGAKEIILIAQDLTNYGKEINGKYLLPELLNALSKIEGIEWIRMHYAYPTGFPEEVIKIMASNPKVCNYLDIPIQHINDRVLSAMNRGHDRKKLESLLSNFREAVPNVALRTTLLVGYPGETDEEFEELLSFVKVFSFDRLGIFPYSHEDDTPATSLTDDIPEDVKQERVNRIMELQQQISFDINQEKIGKSYIVIIDSEEEDYFICRTEHDSQEVV